MLNFLFSGFIWRTQFHWPRTTLWLATLLLIWDLDLTLAELTWMPGGILMWKFLPRILWWNQPITRQLSSTITLRLILWNSRMNFAGFSIWRATLFPHFTFVNYARLINFETILKKKKLIVINDWILMILKEMSNSGSFISNKSRRIWPSFWFGFWLRRNKKIGNLVLFIRNVMCINFESWKINLNSVASLCQSQACRKWKIGVTFTSFRKES